jgi:protein arginine kinase activator
MAKPHLCDICHEHPATVHYTEIVNNKLRKLNLCEHCAQDKGLGVTAHFSVAEILKGLTEAPPAESAEPELTCDFCGLSFSRFKKVGRLGCPHCYETFREQLEPILSDVHKNTEHVGKSPSAGAMIDTTTKRLADLNRELKQAVEHEEYERAAALRDEIKTLEQPQEPTGHDA